MLARKYNSEVVSIESKIKGIYTIELKSPERKYKYSPGQFLHLSVDEEYDGIGQWPESRCFSMQSNPEEDTIRITYSVKGNFTAIMEKKIKIGSQVWLKLPFGNLFTQPHKKKDTVFIAGGTGLTPFLSLFTHYTFTDYTNPRIYIGFRSEMYNIFNKDLDCLIKSFKYFKLIYEDVEGRIDINRIFNDNGVIPNYFISGPPAMIKFFINTLIAKGVPITNILTDAWE